MKTIIVSIFFGLMTFGAAQAANNITVVIDGTPFTCGSNSGGSGNQCECVGIPLNGQWRYRMYKQGSEITTNYYYPTKDEAVSACEVEAVSRSECYN